MHNVELYGILSLICISMQTQELEIKILLWKTVDRQITIRFCIKEFTILGADPAIIYAQP